MAQIQLIRIDFRLIHGQVVTKWVKEANANRIVIVNETLASDEFLGSVYKMAAPSNVKVDILSKEDAIKSWTEDEFGEGKILLLFKSVEDCNTLIDMGFPIKQIQIGGLGGGSGRINTPAGISFNAKDVQVLQEMSNKGIDIYIQVVPTQQKYDIDKVIEKLHFD